jgi:hypothetical protein
MRGILMISIWQSIILLTGILWHAVERHLNECIWTNGIILNVILISSISMSIILLSSILPIHILLRVTTVKEFYRTGHRCFFNRFNFYAIMQIFSALKMTEIGTNF